MRWLRLPSSQTTVHERGLILIQIDGLSRTQLEDAIADGRIYTAGDFQDKEMVVALDPDGELLWKSANGDSWTGSTPGSRTTPTYDDGMVYHMNPTGRLAAYAADTGKEIWMEFFQIRLRSNRTARNNRFGLIALGG